MLNLDYTAEHVAKARDNYARFETLAERYQDDAALRSRIDTGDVTDSLDYLGIIMPPGIETRIVAETAETQYFLLPPDPNMELSDEDLSMVAGGKTAGTSGSLSSASTIGCSTAPSTLSTLASAGTAGTAG